MRLNIFVVICCCITTIYAEEIRPNQAAIASAHPTATEAGFAIYQAGGNAFDAAIAVTATLAVVEPYSSGLGGGGFWLLHRAKDGEQVMIDGRETAPSKAHRDMYLDKDGNVIPHLSINGALSAGIPGVPAAMVYMAKKYGRLSLVQSLKPAIRIAREGFEVTPMYQRMAKFRLEALKSSSAAAAIFLKNNKVPPLGYKIKQYDLAQTLEQIALKGNAGFYRGRLAKLLVDGTLQAGGIWQQKDLQHYKIKVRQPLIGWYNGYKITSVVPPSSGGATLMSILNMLETDNIANLPKVQRSHLLIEAMRRAYRDRAEYLGDSDFVKVPLNKLVSKQYARELRNTINNDRATPSDTLSPVANPDSGFHTTHFSILDKEGNRVSATLSINYPFGSCFVPPGTGVLLNDEMDDFSAKPGVPNAYGLVGAEANAIAPNKRMLSSMSPTFVENKDKLAILGTPGGSRIITMVLHGILGFAEGQSAKEIVAQPRYHHQYLPDVVQFETGAFNADELDKLKQKGHQLKELDSRYGNMQTVIWDKKRNRVSAASDPRGEGLSVVK
jgi:gamma-glutamyltranspeptidase/glutathione hydrolase